MADLPESTGWTSGIYQLETSDPVLGGPEGISNQQARQLANRTKWLKVRHEEIVDGTKPVGKATQLETARALTFKGAATGAGEFDGSVDVEIELTLSDGTTAPRFDDSKKLVNSEWVRLQGKQYSGSTALNNSGSILATTVGQVTVLFGDAASTVNLPSSADLPNGSTVSVVCYNTVSAALTRTGTDLIYGADPGQSVSVKSILMLYGDILELTLLNNVPGAGAWYVTGGTMAVKYSAQFAASLSGPTCYKKLPNGGVEQWGFYASAPAASDVVITLPVAMSAPPTKFELTFANFASGEPTGASPVLQARGSSKGTITVRNLHGAPASFFWAVEGEA